jgi:hypothetical protein
MNSRLSGNWNDTQKVDDERMRVSKTNSTGPPIEAFDRRNGRTHIGTVGNRR